MKCLTNIQKKQNSKGKEQPFKIRAKRTEEDETVYKKHWVQLVNELYFWFHKNWWVVLKTNLWAFLK